MSKDTTRTTRRPTRSASARGLFGAASALALAAGALAFAGAADAQTVTLTPGNSPITIDSCSCTQINVTSGTAYLVPNWGVPWSYPAGAQALDYNNNNLSSAPVSAAPQGGSTLAATLNIAPGATLYVEGAESPIGQQPYLELNGLITGGGNLELGGGGGNPTIVSGNTYIGGNLTLFQNASIYTGEPYGTPAHMTFGPSSDVILYTGAVWNLYEGSNTTTIGGYITAPDHTATINMNSGVLVLNGQNTAGAPFLGTLNIGAGATFVVGDASHPTAIFGDPGNTNGSTETLNVTRSNTGTASVLQGYGTIYATVNNSSGVVQPGGQAGTPGVLTVSKYSQGATGQLNIEVSPTGASELKVLGSATLGGSLIISVDAGKYGNAVFPILSAGSITGTFASITTAGNTAGAIAGLQITSTGYNVVTESASGAQVAGHLATANRTSLNDFAASLYDQIEMNSASGGASKTTYSNGVTAWVEPFARRQTVSHQDIGYSTETGGVMVGAEGRTDRGDTLGLAGSYASQSLTTQAGQTHADTDTYDVALYGRFHLQNARIDGVVFYDKYDATTTRNLGVDGTASASPTGSAYGASLQISQPIYGNLIVPYLRGVYTYNSQDLMTETGAGPLALRLNALGQDFVTGDAGVRIHPNMSVAGQAFRPEILLAVEHDFSRQGETVTGQFATISGAPFTFNWKGDQGTAGVVGLHLATDIAKRVEVYGRLDGRFSASSSGGDISLGARYRF